MMLPKNLSREQFIEQTAGIYMRDYRLPHDAAFEAAEDEWQIRQEVANMKRLPQIQLKTKNTRAGFGLRGVCLHVDRKPKEKPVVHKDRVFHIDREAYNALRTKRYITKEDVCRLLSGADDFLKGYARLFGFPKYSIRLGGYTTWEVYAWLDKFKRKKGIKL